MIEGTLDVAARAFGSILTSAKGRNALQRLGLSGPDAPTFVCALYDTTVEEVAQHVPATVLVIDITRDRVASLRIEGSPTDDEDYEVHPTTKLGFVVDCIVGSKADISTSILGDVHGQITQLA